jgi:repressor LexA
MRKLSNRQKDILNFIIRENEIKGYPPTVREIGEAVGLASSSTVHGHLTRLEKKGLIRRDPTKPRAIEVVYPEFSTRSVPIVGKVTAGVPILAVEEIQEYIQFPEEILGSGTVYMLRVSGMSMMKTGIFDGDLVLVRKQNHASNGEIVVAMTEDNEATVKRFYKEDGYYRLHPENDSMSDIVLEKVTILGTVIGFYRTVS